MELPDQSEECVRKAKLVHAHSQPFTAHRVKGLGQANKVSVVADILFLTLLLQQITLSIVPQPWRESRQTLWQQALLEVLVYMVQQDPG